MVNEIQRMYLVDGVVVTKQLGLSITFISVIPVVRKYPLHVFPSISKTMLTQPFQNHKTQHGEVCWWRVAHVRTSHRQVNIQCANFSQVQRNGFVIGKTSFYEWSNADIQAGTARLDSFQGLYARQLAVWYLKSPSCNAKHNFCSQNLISSRRERDNQELPIESHLLMVQQIQSVRLDVNKTPYCPS